jgi:ankyrin repeat protein
MSDRMVSFGLDPARRSAAEHAELTSAIPRLPTPWPLLLGLLPGALAGHLLGGTMAMCVAAPFLEHILNLGGAIGLAAGLLSELRRDRWSAGRQLLLVLTVVLVLLAAGQVLLYPELGLIADAPQYDELGRIGAGEAAGTLVRIGWGAGAALLGLVQWLAVANLVAMLVRWRPRVAAGTWRKLAGRIAVVLAALIVAGAPVTAWFAREQIFLALARAEQTGWVERVLALDSSLVHATDAGGRTALHHASSGADTGLASVLITRGTDVNAATVTGQTPLHQARGGAPMVQVLVAGGALVDARDLSGTTPLMQASARDDGEAVSALLAAGATVRLQDHRGLTALHWAHNQAGITSLLLARGADVNATTNDGRTPLMLACSVANAEVVEVLLAAGAEVARRDHQGDAALHLAARRDAARIIEMLLARGADAEARDRNGQTLLEVAEREGSSKVAAMLRSLAAPPEPVTVERERLLAVEATGVPELMQARQVPVIRTAHRHFETLTFGDWCTPLLDIDSDGDTLWVATASGLLRYRPGHDSADLWGEGSGIPGVRVNKLAAASGRLAADLSVPTRPGYATGIGTFVFSQPPAEPQILLVGQTGVGSCWGLDWGTGRFWCASSEGLIELDPKTGDRHNLWNRASGLIYDQASAVVVAPDTLWVTSFGDYDSGIEDFRGGGVSRMDRSNGRWQRYAKDDGLARSYCCDIAVDARQAWVVHWEEELGVSVLDLAGGRWQALRQSSNGLDIGGVRVKLDRRYAWIAQQGGLVRVERDTLAATVFLEADGVPGFITSGIAMTPSAVWVTAYSYSSGDQAKTCGLVRLPHQD